MTVSIYSFTFHSEEKDIKKRHASMNHKDVGGGGGGGGGGTRRVQPNGGQVHLLYQHFNTNITVEAFTSKP